MHRTYGPAFGPWRPATVRGQSAGTSTLLAVGGTTDLLAALAAVAADWHRLSADDRGGDRIPPCPVEPTAGDVAGRAPHGLLVRRGLVRLDGSAEQGDEVPAELLLPVDRRPGI